MPPVVSDLASAFRWPLDYARSTVVHDRLWCIQNNFGRLRLSTSFSGVCAPSTALHMLNVGLSASSCTPIELDYVFAVERLHESQMELQLLPSPPRHIYIYIYIHQDVEHFCSDDTMRLLRPFGAALNFAF